MILAVLGKGWWWWGFGGSGCPGSVPAPFLSQVVQVLNADAIVMKLNSGDYKTIHLSSIRPPRLEGEGPQVGHSFWGGEDGGHGAG